MKVTCMIPVRIDTFTVIRLDSQTCIDDIEDALSLG